MRAPRGARWMVLGYVTMGALVAAAFGSVGSTGLAEDDSCENHLLVAPLEETVLPDGWQWDALGLGQRYVPAAITTVWGELTDLETETRAFLHLSCEPGAAQVVERVTAVKMQAGATEVEAESIGDESIALAEPDVHSSDDRTITTVLWRNGDLLGRLFTSADVDPADLGEVVRSVSDVLVGVGLGPGASAPADACLTRLLDAPLEALELPEGWMGRLGLGTEVFLTSPSTWVGGFGAGEDAFVTLSLSCDPNADLLLERAAEVAKTIGAVEHDVGTIGDAAFAVETFDEDGDSAGITLVWRSGDAVGVIGREEGSLGPDALASLARDVSGLLEEAGLTQTADATAPDEACERRLLEAPLETLHDTGEPWSGPYPGLGTVPATWVSGSYLRTFSLSCEPAAALIMERDTELRLRTGLTTLEVAPIGDGSVATGDRGGGLGTYILWRNGDVLGRVDLGPYESLETMERFAQRVNGLLD